MSNNNQQFNGIDEREIKCCDTKPGTIQAGISFDQEDDVTILRFHFLQRIDSGRLDQATKSMHLNITSINQLIARLLELGYDMGESVSKSCKKCKHDEHIKRDSICKYCDDYDHWEIETSKHHNE